jgi:flagellin-specific chaperone FliS
MEMAHKNLPIEDGTFQIQYFENIVYDKNYFEEFKNSFIKILFIPNTKLSIQKVLEIIEPYKPTLQKEVEEIIKTNQDVYKYFDYQLSFNNHSNNSEMDLATRMEFIVCITLPIDLTLKED